MTEPIAKTTDRRGFRLLIAGFVILKVPVAGIAGWIYLLHDSGNQPLRNKQTMLEVQNWFDVHGGTPLPNVDGRSADSLIKFKKAAYGPGDFDQQIAEWKEITNTFLAFAATILVTWWRCT